MSNVRHARLVGLAGWRRRSMLTVIPAAVALAAGLAAPFNIAAASAALAPSGTISTFAGGGVGDGRPATTAQLGNLTSFGHDGGYVYGLAVDPSGSVLVATGPAGYQARIPADVGWDRVRRIDASSGQIATVAGTSTSGPAGDGSPAVRAQLALPHDVVSDRAGNLYILDSGNDRVRKVSAATGAITTIAGGGRGNVGFLFSVPPPGPLAGDGGWRPRPRLAFLPSRTRPESMTSSAAPRA